jgi:hypothetical protein
MPTSSCVVDLDAGGAAGPWISRRTIDGWKNDHELIASEFHDVNYLMRAVDRACAGDGRTVPMP